MLYNKFFRRRVHFGVSNFRCYIYRSFCCISIAILNSCSCVLALEVLCRLEDLFQFSIDCIIDERKFHVADIFRISSVPFVDFIQLSGLWYPLFLSCPSLWKGTLVLYYYYYFILKFYCCSRNPTKTGDNSVQSSFHVYTVDWKSSQKYMKKRFSNGL